MKSQCDNFEHFLAGEITGGEFTAHKNTCPHCEKSYAEDSRIMAAAATLNKNLAVPDQWEEIRHAIILAGNEKPARYRRSTVAAWAAAAAVLISVSFWLAVKAPSTNERSRLLTTKALADVKNAESNYMEAIDRLENIAMAKLNETDEPLAQLYRNKINLIDNQISSCRKALEKNPANAHIRRYLLAALQDMESTLSDILELKG